MRIAEKLEVLKKAGRKALTVFSTVGDPDWPVSLDIFSRFEEWGADIAELGIPYSDPLMDGPVLQRSYQRALRAGFKMAALPGFIEDVRRRSEIPMLVMTCCNPIFKYGVRRFFSDVTSAGADAVLVTDLPLEEWGESLDLAKSFGLGVIMLITPTTTIKRMEIINGISEPFVYCVSRAGVTGASDSLPAELTSFAGFARDIITKPMLIGFGISTPDQARSVSKLADGVIIGSAFAAIIENNIESKLEIMKTMGRFVTDVRAAMDT